jgi:hypothetical protein
MFLYAIVRQQWNQFVIEMGHSNGTQVLVSHLFKSLFEQSIETTLPATSDAISNWLSVVGLQSIKELGKCNLAVTTLLFDKFDMLSSSPILQKNVMADLKSLPAIKEKSLRDLFVLQRWLGV